LKVGVIAGSKAVGILLGNGAQAIKNGAGAKAVVNGIAIDMVSNVNLTTALTNALVVDPLKATMNSYNRNMRERGELLDKAGSGIDDEATNELLRRGG
jgi:hypothetical protein